MAGKVTLAGVIANATRLSNAELGNLAAWIAREQKTRAQAGAGGDAHNTHLAHFADKGKLTYRLELVTCGHEGCYCMTGGALHGPYWYSYKHEDGRMKKKYIGKNTPRELGEMEGGLS